MLEYGLSDITIGKLYSVFNKYDSITQVLLYGSRAKGNYKEGSDIDLTITDSVDSELLYKINNDIEQLLLPYKVDLSIYNQINNPDLKEHIKRVGSVFYKND